jgi:sarcosine oxidase
VVVASPCSGFGFKFASAVGEILAGLLLDEAAGAVDLIPFRIGRLSPGGG